jgi:hypothetical protein
MQFKMHENLAAIYSADLLIDLLKQKSGSESSAAVQTNQIKFQYFDFYGRAGKE